LEPAQEGVALQVLRCGRTRVLAEAEADLRELGLGAIPVNVNVPNEVPDEEKKNVVERKRDQPAAGGCASCSVGAPRGARSLGIVVALALGLMVGLRRR
jgi:MYXO-CTERM domain-containing protein